MRLALILLIGSCGFKGAAGEVRLGIIGCDTSHVVEFTELLNNPQAKDHVSGARVVAVFKGGSPDIPSSWSRVDGYTKTLQERYGATICDSIEELCAKVDGVLLESVDGRPHLAQAKLVMGAHKPLFIDKPMAGSLADVREIFRLARAAKVPVFSSSALRFGKATQAVRHGSVGKVTDAEMYGPCEREPHHPDLFWYGVHGVEALFTVLGTGCQTVQRSTTAQGKIEVVGIWSDGRKGIFRESSDFRGHVKGEKGEAVAGMFDGYAPLVAEIVKFFESGIAPVSAEETLEIFKFMEAEGRKPAERRRTGATQPLRASPVLSGATRAGG